MRGTYSHTYIHTHIYTLNPSPVCSALQHKWLGKYAASDDELRSTQLSLRALSRDLQAMEEEGAASETEAAAMGWNRSVPSQFVLYNNPHTAAAAAAIRPNPVHGPLPPPPPTPIRIPPSTAGEPSLGVVGRQKTTVAIDDVDLISGASNPQTMVVSTFVYNSHGEREPQSSSVPPLNIEQLQLAPLLNLQR